jgi:hypothetical protein
MSTSQILEVAIGLVFVYYVLGAVVSFVTQLILESAETRGAALEEKLKAVAGDKSVDLLNLPQIKALQPIRYTSWMGVFGAKIEQKKVEKIPVAMMVDAFFDVTGLTGRPEIKGDELTDFVNQLPESEGKQALLKWIKQGVTDINALRGHANDYFSGVLNQAASTFKSNARSIVIIFSMILVFALGTDTIQLVRDLWNNAELRSVAATEATMAAQNGNTLTVDDIIKSLSDTTMRIAWWQIGDTFPAQGAGFPVWTIFIILKIIGLSMTALAVSQGSSFWYDLLKKLTTPGGGGSSDSSSNG